MFDRILCAHDLSEHGTPVLRAALDLGRRLKATVHVLHVITPPLSIPPGLWFEVPAPDIVSFEEKLRQATIQELERAIGGRGSQEYRQASSGELSAAAAAMMAGDPFDVAAERAARDSGWRN